MERKGKGSKNDDGYDCVYSDGHPRPIRAYQAIEIRRQITEGKENREPRKIGHDRFFGIGDSQTLCVANVERGDMAK